MKNIYDGVVTLDASGGAVVELPDWFEALNRDFRYQLTAIGDRVRACTSPRRSTTMHSRSRRTPGLEVSWQVTGIRQDAYANKHRIPVEEDKPAGERGKYLHPDAYGKPMTRGSASSSSRISATLDPARDAFSAEGTPSAYGVPFRS